MYYAPVADEELLLDTPLSSPASMPWHARRVAPALLVGAIVAWLALDLVLLWRFVDFAPAWSYPFGALFVAGLAVAAGRAMRGVGEGPTVATLLACAGVALVLYLLGGEGRVFYANTDWKVRDGVLHDMGTHPWPYAYMARGLPELLRAPLGLYLVPALALKVGGQRAGDIALLLQNAALLTLLLGLCAQLFASPARRATALAVFVFFSGLDIVGAAMTRLPRGLALPDHLEWWSGLQYSSHITQLFWVPQHALAGWLCAGGYMLWRGRRMPLGLFLALVPLTILWSPLAALGALPFAALAGIETLARRALRPGDLLLPAAATLLTLPALLYLAAAGDTVGGGGLGLDWGAYRLTIMFEVAPFLFVLATARCPHRFGWATSAVVAACLLLMPLVQVGTSADFMTRASIPAFAILAVIVADTLMAEPRRDRRVMIAVILAIGAMTGLREINRAVMWPASPPPLCSFFGAWGPSPPSAKSTYLAAVERLPRPIRPHAVTLVPDRDPPVCFARPWPKPTGI